MLTKTTKSEKKTYDQNEKNDKDRDTRGFGGSGVEQEGDRDETHGALSIVSLIRTSRGRPEARTQAKLASCTKDRACI
jgi:hypothetical protein